MKKSEEKIYEIVLMKPAEKELRLLNQEKSLIRKAEDLIEILKKNPFENPPQYEKLSGGFERGIFKKN